MAAKTDNCKACRDYRLMLIQQRGMSEDLANTMSSPFCTRTGPMTTKEKGQRNIYMQDEEWQALKESAKKRRMSAAELIRVSWRYFEEQVPVPASPDMLAQSTNTEVEQ
jgi:hypothetical protein